MALSQRKEEKVTLLRLIFRNVLSFSNVKTSLRLTLRSRSTTQKEKGGEELLELLPPLS